MKRSDQNGGNKKMIITIIGSLSKRTEMNECKEYFERFGHRVNTPNDPELQKKSLYEIQCSWIQAIKEADLVVAIPKMISLAQSAKSDEVLEFGESTSYEMAIATEFEKRLIYWP